MTINIQSSAGVATPATAAQILSIKASLGLDLVDNLRDADRAINSATTAAIAAMGASLSAGNMVSVAHAYANAQFSCFGLPSGMNVLLATATIPANTLGPTSMVNIKAMFTFPGGGSMAKDALIRIGIAGGTFASAVNILNNQGFTTQKAFIVDITGQNKNSVGSNIWTPPQNPVGGNQGPNIPISYAIDFSQDVIVYFGGTNTAPTTGPTDTATANDNVRLETYSITVAK